MVKKVGSKTSPLRVVLDSNVVISASLFRSGQLAWLRDSWQRQHFVPIASRATIDEIMRVLGYQKFQLGRTELGEIMALYLPFVETFPDIETSRTRIPVCNDPQDQKFLILASAGRADVLVTGDKALLELSGKTNFQIESPAAFRRRFAEEL